jgi:hypothetical protein
MKPKPKEVLTESSVTKPVATKKEFEHNMNILIRNYEDKNIVSNM